MMVYMASTSAPLLGMYVFYYLSLPRSVKEFSGGSEWNRSFFL